MKSLFKVSYLLLGVLVVLILMTNTIKAEDEVTTETKPSLFDPYFSSRFEGGFSTGGGTKTPSDGEMPFESTFTWPKLIVTAAEGPSVDGIPFHFYSAKDTTNFYNSTDCGNFIGDCSNYAATGYTCSPGEWLVDLAESCGGFSNSDAPLPGDTHIFWFEQEELAGDINHAGYYGITNIYVDSTTATSPQEAQAAELLVEQKALPVSTGFSGAQFDATGNPTSTPKKCVSLKWNPAFEALDTTCPAGVSCDGLIGGTGENDRLVAAYNIYRSFDGVNFAPDPIGTVPNVYTELNDWVTFEDCSVPVGTDVYYAIGLVFYIDPLVAGIETPMETSIFSANSNKIVVPLLNIVHNSAQSETVLQWDDVTDSSGAFPGYYEIWGSNGGNIADSTESTLIRTVSGGLGPYSETVPDNEPCSAGTCNYYRVIAIFW